MREIKFRGRRVNNGEWVFGYYVMARGHSYILPLYNNNGFDERYHLEGTDEFGWYEVDPKTVGQFTGLKDKNGVELYFGDIFKHNENIYVVVDSEVCGMVAVVKNKNLGNIINDGILMNNHNYRDRPWVFNVKKHIEILGSVHTNPELLND